MIQNTEKAAHILSISLVSNVYNMYCREIFEAQQ